MAQQDDIIIRVDVDVAKVKKELSLAIAEIQDLKSAQAELNKQYKDGTITAEEYGKATAENKQRITELSKTIRTNTSLVAAAQVEDIKANATLDEKRAALNALQKAYGQLTDEQKNAEIGGKTLTDRIKELSDAVKEEESAIGDNRRNVGNYTESIKQAFPQIGKFADMLNKAKGVAADLPGALKGITGGLKSLTMQALKFIATPIGAILAAVAVAVKLLFAAFDKLKEAIAKNDDASTGLARVYAVTIQPIVNTMTKIFGALADIVGKVANKFADWASKLTGAAEHADDMVKSVDNLEEAERQYALHSAERAKDVAELRDKAMQKDKYTADERRKFLQDALELEQKNLEEEKQIKAERLRILEETAKDEQDTSDETKNKINQARIDMLNAETNYYNGTRRMVSQMQALNKEIDADEQKRLEEARKRAEERKKILIEQYFNEREQAEILRSLTEKGAEKQKPVEEGEEDDSDAEEQLNKQLALLNKLKEAQKTEQQRQYDSDLAFLNELHDAKLISEEEYLQRLQELNKQYMQDEQLARAENAVQTAQLVLSSLSQMNDAFNQIEEAELQGFKDGQEQRKKALEKRLQAGEISQAEYAKQTEAIDEEVERKEKETAREQAKRDKALGIFNAVISTAGAIIGFLANPGFPLGIPLSVAAGITGAAQIAAIAAQPLPAFEHGGTIDGTSFTGDNVLIRANSGEGVMTGKQANNVLQEIANNPARGGFDYELMAEAMSAQPAPVMAYEEFKRFEQDVATYDEIARV